MKLSSIDIASLPGPDQVTGLFGSALASGPATGDRLIVIMVYVYDVTRQVPG